MYIFGDFGVLVILGVSVVVIWGFWVVVGYITPLVCNSRKSVRWSAVPVAPVFVYVSVMVRGAAAPQGPMTYAQ